MAIEFINELKREIRSSLPSSAGIIGKLIKIISDKSSNANDLTDIINRDPTLAARILKMANSAYYGATSEINTLQRAVVSLGFDTIRELAYTTAVVHHLFSSDSSNHIDRLGLWLHSVGTARASRLITDKIKIEQPDKAYTVGLLHDIGKILLVLIFPDRYAEIIQLANEKKCRVILAERKLLNIDHTMVGKTLCDIWSIPDDISTAILYHHDPMETPKGSQKLSRIINLADYMCRRAKIGYPGDDTLTKPSPATLALLGPTPEKINDTFIDIFKKLFIQKSEMELFYTSLE